MTPAATARHDAILSAERRATWRHAQLVGAIAAVCVAALWFTGFFDAERANFASGAAAGTKIDQHALAAHLVKRLGLAQQRTLRGTVTVKEHDHVASAVVPDMPGFQLNLAAGNRVREEWELHDAWINIVDWPRMARAG
jgi:predicted acyl esterase